MDVRFLRAYRGELTAERYYRAGEVTALPNGEALILVEQGVCEPARPTPEPNVPGKSTKRRKARPK